MAKRKKFQGFVGGYYSGPGGYAGGGGVVPVGSSVTLSITSQPFISDLEFPTHWSIPFAQGAVTGTPSFFLRERTTSLSEHSVNAQFRPISRWPDGSIRWMHVYGNAKWEGGVPGTYKLRWGYDFSAPSTSELVLSESATGYNVNTGPASFVIPKAYPGIVGEGIGGGGPFIVDNSGNRYAPTGTNIITIEESGTARFTLRMECDYSHAVHGTFAKYITRITAYRNSAIVNFDHATVFTADMRTRKIASMGVDFSGNTHQILTRFLEEKEPAVISGGHFYQWPMGLADTNTASDYEIYNSGTYNSTTLHRFYNSEVWKCSWLRKGPYLDANVPSGYLSSFGSFAYTGAIAAGSEGATHSQALSGHMAGIANHYDFAVNLGTTVSALQNVYYHKPVGQVSLQWIEDTQAPGQLAVFKNDDYAAVDDFVLRAISGIYNAYYRYDEKGWHLFGNNHHQEYPYSAKPDVYRGLKFNHYTDGQMLWQTYMASASTGILKWARANADFYTSLGQMKIELPSLGSAYKAIPRGSYRHTYQFTPWGLNTQDSLVYEDQARASHAADPGAQIYAWYLDENRWAKEGFDHWVTGMSTGTLLTPGGAYNCLPLSATTDENFRNTSNALNGLLLAYEDNPNTLMSGVSFSSILNTIANNHFDAQFLDSSTKMLFSPQWICKFHENFPNHAGATAWIDVMVTGTGLGGVPRSILLNDSWTMALRATHYTIFGNSGVLTPFSGLLTRFPQRVVRNASNPAWEGFGNYCGPIAQEQNFLLQWPRLRRALDQIPTLPSYNDPGTWFAPGTRTTDAVDFTGRSIQLYTTIGAGTQNIVVKQGRPRAGSLPDVRYGLITSGGTVISIGTGTDSSFTNETLRPSSFTHETVSGVIPYTGLCKILMAPSEGTHIFRDSYPNNVAQPMVQLIKDVRRGGYGGEFQRYGCGPLSGILYPISGQSIQITASSLGPIALGYIEVNGVGQWMLASSIYTTTISSAASIRVYTEVGNLVGIEFSGVGQPVHPGKLALFGSADDVASLMPSITGNFF